MQRPSALEAPTILRERLSRIVLVVAGLALIATSPPYGTTETVTGEAIVGPGRPAVFDIGFRVRPSFSIDPEAFQGDGRIIVPVVGEGRYASSIQVLVAGTPVALQGSAFTLPVEPCRTGCDVAIRVDLTWVGPPEPDMHVRWSASVTVGPTSAGEVISATASVGEPLITRLLWYGMGLLAGALSAVAWLAAGRRFTRPRLAIAAFGILVPWVFAAPHLLLMTSVDASVVWLLVSNVGTLAFLTLPLLVLGYGLWRHRRGRAMPLAVGGWLVSVALGMVFATTVDSAWTYRPFELFALGLLVSIPGAAAITSPALLAAGSEATPGRVLVMASQTVLIGLVGLFVILFGAELGRAMLSQRPVFSVDALAVELVLVGVAALLIIALRRWGRGRNGVLVLANGLLLLPTGLYAWVAIDGLGGLFAGSFVTQLAAIALVSIVAVGFFGGLVVQPPSRPVEIQGGAAPAEPQRDEQGGQREEVGGVGDERHGPEVGDRG